MAALIALTRSVVVAALALAALAAQGGNPPQGLRLSAVAEPTVARPGQTVTIRLSWSNGAAAGGPLLRVNRRGLPGQEVRIDVRGPGGLTVPLKALPQRPLEDADFQTLAPGESFAYNYDLGYLSLITLRPGRYTVRVVYRNDDARGEPKAWTGRLWADTAFRVKPR